MDRLSPKTLYWDWDNGKERPFRTRIDTNDISFPKDFRWGVSTASHQIEGYGNQINSNWAKWESEIDSDGKPRVKDKQDAKIACDHWNRVDEDIGLLKELGVNSYRFSVDWAKIEPSPGEYSEEALEHYEKEILAIIKDGISCMVTLHHFTHPLWFEELGGFEKEENIEHFLRFSELVFKRYSNYVKIWCTFNEPVVFVTGGWVSGTFPPGKKDLSLSSVVLKNVLEAHVKTYQKLKSLDNGPSTSIGIVKNIFLFEPSNRFNPLDVFICNTVDYAFNECTLKFFETGQYDFKMIGTKAPKYTNLKAKNSNDFVGLNYYSHFHVRSIFNMEQPWEFEHRDNVLMTDMTYPLYPEGLYIAIKRISKLKIPIYITENGIADADDSRRHLFLRRYLYAVSKAMKEGADVRGYYYWSLMDNFEWADGYDMRFGLYEVDFKTQKRTLRDGSKYYKQVIERFK